MAYVKLYAVCWPAVLQQYPSADMQRARKSTPLRNFANFSTRQTAIAQKFYTLITKLYTYDNDKNIDNNNSEGFLKIQVRQQNTNLPYGVSS